MLLSLISLSDDEIERVTTAVRDWCRAHRYDVDSIEGRRALNVAIDLVQSKHADICLVPELSNRLDPLPENYAGGEL